VRRLMNIQPGRLRWPLALLPFVLLALLYGVGATLRHAENPDDKVLPPVVAMVAAVERTALMPDKRTGEYVFWSDTGASLQRLAIGIGGAVAIGLLPTVNALLAPLTTVLSMIPPMALLPILFIIFGLGELSKVVLIVVGVAPCLVRDLALAVGKLPREQIVKAQTLGASTWQVLLRIALPQALPRLIESLRLALGPAFLFLISAEAISAENGLGYRIFLVRRYLAMDVILPYVAWITLLAYLMDTALAGLSRRVFPWAHGAGHQG
jgi:NitT/TauT family transport system permease protein